MKEKDDHPEMTLKVKKRVKQDKKETVTICFSFSLEFSVHLSHTRSVNDVVNRQEATEGDEKKRKSFTNGREKRLKAMKKGKKREKQTLQMQVRPVKAK